MRYVIKTNDTAVWNSINSWQQQGKLQIIERGDLGENLKEKVDRIHEALDALKKAGVSNYLMVQFLRQECHLPEKDIKHLLDAQRRFFSEMGIK